MYLFFGCLLVIILVFFIFFRHKRKKICRRLQNMSCEEKCDTLGPLVEPFGYCYNPSQDVFSTTIDAPQRAFGYTALFDRLASHFGMVFDCLPIYFDYLGRTWLIEFWKGQYGINLGCEVGIYKADSLVSTIGRKTALFQSVENAEMLPMSIRLFHHDRPLCQVYGKHWWLTAFRMGYFSEPQNLWMQVCITFPNREMLAAFANALQEQGNTPFHTCGRHIRILFQGCTSRFSLFQKLIRRVNQWWNRFSCRLFLWVTKPFQTGMDRLLCLYFYLPRVFRRILKDKKRRKCCKKCCRSQKKKEKCHENRL